MDAASTRDDLERRWLRAVAIHDREAFEALFRAYEQRLLGYFLRLVGDRGRSEELTCDVLFEVWQQARRFRGDSRPSTWIFGIAHHKGVSALRRRRPPAVEAEAASGLADPAPTPEQRAEGAQRLRNVEEAMRSLTAEHREVLRLFYAEGLSVREIATVQKCPASTVKTRLFYARQHLRPLLEEDGGAPS